MSEEQNAPRNDVAVGIAQIHQPRQSPQTLEDLVATAQFQVGWMYSKGPGVSRDDKTAVKWYRVAAEQGMPLLSTIWV